MHNTFKYLCKFFSFFFSLFFLSFPFFLFFFLFFFSLIPSFLTACSLDLSRLLLVVSPPACPPSSSQPQSQSAASSSPPARAQGPPPALRALDPDPPMGEDAATSVRRRARAGALPPSPSAARPSPPAMSSVGRGGSGASPAELAEGKRAAVAGTGARSDGGSRIRRRRGRQLCFARGRARGAPRRRRRPRRGGRGRRGRVRWRRRALPRRSGRAARRGRGARWCGGAQRVRKARTLAANGFLPRAADPCRRRLPAATRTTAAFSVAWPRNTRTGRRRNSRRLGCRRCSSGGFLQESRACLRLYTGRCTCP
ncbi:unnamed protein product [Urochloa humidicola]